MNVSGTFFDCFNYNKTFSANSAFFINMYTTPYFRRLLEEATILSEFETKVLLNTNQEAQGHCNCFRMLLDLLTFEAE